MDFISQLVTTFNQNRNSALAVPMENYMKNNFPFFGIKTEARRSLLKQVWNQHEATVRGNTREIVNTLLTYKERELHYCAVEIATKNLKNNYQKSDIRLIEKMLTTHSWWDSVDTISKFILGAYLQQFPEETTAVVTKFSNSENRWLNRSTLLFQLGYKQKTDADLLYALCIKMSHSKEFFIQKAIGWALREYGKTNPMEVKSFVIQENLKALSQKEALKNIV